MELFVEDGVYDRLKRVPSTVRVTFTWKADIRKKNGTVRPNRDPCNDRKSPPIAEVRVLLRSRYQKLKI